MKPKLLACAALVAAFMTPSVLLAQRPIVLDPSYEHTKWGIEPSDHVFRFAAFTTSFDGLDDDDRDGDADAWGIPEWVSYEIKRMSVDHPLSARPKWFTDDSLRAQGLAPDDGPYHVSGTRALPIVKDSYRYVRGHMCPKDVAERISVNAAYNTHTILNAVPQLQWQNNGIWKSLEAQCTDWADEYGRIWVVCGPVFFDRSPAVWLGQDGEQKAAVPDALFKVIIREQGNGLKTLAFTIPNVLPPDQDDFWAFATTIDEIEEDTGLDFMTRLSTNQQRAIEANKGSRDDW